MYRSSDSRSYSFECPSCRSEINLPNSFVQKCTWNKNNRLKEDLRNLTDKWSLIKKEIGYVDCVKHIHAISDYLEDVIELFQHSALGKHAILEDAYTNTDEWPPANAQMMPYDQQASCGAYKVEPQHPVSQPFPAPQQQQAQGGGMMGDMGSWNQQQWENRQFPVNTAYPNVNMNQMPQYGSAMYNQNFQGNFQNQGYFQGNFQNYSSNDMQNTSNSYSDNFIKRKFPRPPKELIEIKTGGYIAKKEIITDAPKAKIQNNQPESVQAFGKGKNRRVKRKNIKKNVAM